MINISIADKRSDAPTLAAVFRRNLTPSYISHAELQSRRAISPSQWAADVEDVLRVEIEQRLREPLSHFPDQGSWRGVLEIRKNSNLVGISFVTVTHDAAVPYGIIEDIVIDSAKRGSGIGSHVMEWILGQFKRAGLNRAFLESGLHNDSAHHLFERLGFQTLSIVMMRDL